MKLAFRPNLHIWRSLRELISLRTNVALEHVQAQSQSPTQVTSDESQPAWTATEMGQILRSSSPPLIHNDARMIVLFSPKSACSSVVIWFLHQIGEAEAARQYDPWPHNYRIQIYYRSEDYRKALSLDLENFSVVRVVRDPFERAVSSFRHVIGTKLREEVSELSQRNIETDGMSFAEFLDFLECCDLETCNAHYGQQRHPVEDRLQVRHLINVSTQDLFTRLNEVEADLDMPITDFAKLEWLHQTEHTRHRFQYVNDVADVYKTRFKPRTATKGPWPSSSAFLTPIARERIARLYAVDINAYLRPPQTCLSHQRGWR